MCRHQAHSIEPFFCFHTVLFLNSESQVFYFLCAYIYMHVIRFVFWENSICTLQISSNVTFGRILQPAQEMHIWTHTNFQSRNHEWQPIPLIIFYIRLILCQLGSVLCCDKTNDLFVTKWTYKISPFESNEHCARHVIAICRRSFWGNFFLLLLSISSTYLWHEQQHMLRRVYGSFWNCAIDFYRHFFCVCVLGSWHEFVWFKILNASI